MNRKRAKFWGRNECELNVKTKKKKKTLNFRTSLFNVIDHLFLKHLQKKQLDTR